MTQATPPRPDACPFTSVLLLADREANAVVDKAALRAVGIPRLRFSTSGIDTAQQLAAQVSKLLMEPTELIVCLPRLGDMRAEQFAMLIRSHPLLSYIPLLAMAAEPAQVARMQKSGFSQVLLRPFNSNTLSNMLFSLGQSATEQHTALLEQLREHPGIPSRDKFDTLLARFTPLTPDAMSPEAAYRHGIMLMKNHEWEEALPFLEKALQDTTVRGDASMALSAFWTVNKEMDKAEAYLKDSLRCHLECQAWDKATKALQRLQKEFPHVDPQLLKLLERRARQNHYEWVLQLVKLLRSTFAPHVLADAILNGAKSSLTPAQTVPTLIKLVEQEGFPDIAYFMTSQVPPEAGATKKRWATMRGKEEKKAAEAKKLPSSEVALSSPNGMLPAPLPQIEGAGQSAQKISLVPEEEKARPRPLEFDLPVELAPDSPPAYADKSRHLPSESLPEAGQPSSASSRGRAAKKTGGGAIDLLGADTRLDLQPSRFGDALTMIKGTLRLYGKSKK